jgi:uncharacterized protein (DUF2147 family)
MPWNFGGSALNGFGVFHPCWKYFAMRRAMGPILGCVITLALCLICAAAGAAITAPDTAAPHGLWLVEDGSAIIELSACADTICGQIYWSKDLETALPGEFRDTSNPRAELRSRPICGLPIITGLRPEGTNAWGGGMVYNPEDGQTYGAEMRLDSKGRLRFRGYLALPLFGDTQIWTRPANAPKRCMTPPSVITTALGKP